MSWNDIFGIVIIILLFSFYALFKDNPMKGLENAGKVTDKILEGIKRLVHEVERI